jgi:hypothetical protein
VEKFLLRYGVYACWIEELKTGGAARRARAAIKLGHLREPRGVEALVAAATDPSAEVQLAVTLALGRMGDPAGLPALGKHGAPSDRETLLQGLDDPVPEVRARAAYALRQVWGMDHQIVANALTTRSRRSINSLISEWDRAGFLYHLVAGLVTRDMARFAASQGLLQMLITAGITQTLASLVLVFPDVKVRLRLVRLLLKNPSSVVAAELQSLVDRPECDARVASAIRRALTARPVVSNPDLRAEAS